MVRFIITLGLYFISSLALFPPAQADPTGPGDVARELENRGSTLTRMGILSGVPVVSGSLETLGYTAHMYDCFDDQLMCEKIVLKSCYEPLQMERLAQLELTNAFNRDYDIANAFVTSETDRVSIMCVSQTVRLDEKGSEFSIRESDAWVRAVRTFVEHVEAEQRSQLAKSILGKEIP